MSSQWYVELTTLRSQREKLDKQIALLEELVDLEAQHGGHQVRSVAARKSARTAVADNLKPRRAKKTSRQIGVVVSSDGKNIRLPQLLVSIGQQQSSPVKLDELCKLVKEAGYESYASNFSNMVYQSLQKLIKKGFFARNDETREYAFTGNLQTA
jgi:hypothetical protein